MRTRTHNGREYREVRSRDETGKDFVGWEHRDADGIVDFAEYVRTTGNALAPAELLKEAWRRVQEP